MFSFPKNLFKRNLKSVKTGLEKAYNEGLITEEEFLRLVVERATRELEDYLKSNLKSKKIKSKK